MGGTSTDISLIEDGAPHLTSEKLEAGWKIAVPMIDIQTLGAGGGSIARVDTGGLLRVGPESAGADPGPACYARRGQKPTVTDANLVLGYLGAGSFLGGRTRLDADVATAALDADVAGPMSLTTAEAAYGIHRLVSSNIAEGIRLASVKRGIDPRDFAIVAFGGASGLHVSSVARQLRVENVYIPSAAPVLSALGMLSTDLQYDFSRSHSASLAGIDLDAVRSVLGELEREGVAKLRARGLEESQIDVVRTAEMRYLDQVYEVNIPVPDLDRTDPSPVEAWAENFHRRYEELYSYQQSEQEIRLVTLRVSVLGRLPKVDPPMTDPPSADEALVEKERRPIFLGEWRDAPVYETDRLPVGHEIAGPAVLESEFTTILVGSGDRALRDEHGGIRLSVGLTLAGDAAGTAPDPITLAVVENRLESIAMEMMEVMLRTSMSQILNSSRDFSTCILDADCQLVAQGEGIPVHISALPIAGAAVRDYFAGDMTDGDLFAVNDPYFGGSHLPDLTIIKPIFYEGKLLFYSVNRAHHSDIGGGTHGGYNPLASEIFHEGLRIPPLRIHDKGTPRRDVLQMMAANGRHPEGFLGDINAQIGSVNIAARRMRTLLDAYGPEVLLRTVKDVLAATERQVRGFISEWPDGVYKGETFVDDDGFDSEMIPIRATVTIEGDSMAIDMSESHSQVTGFINSAYANTRSLAHAAIMYMAPSDVAKNEGSMRPVTVIAPKGLIVNPNPPAPVCMSTNHCGEEVVEAIFKALSAAVPDAVNAGFSRRLRYAITGVDPRTGRTFLWHFFLARGGGGASRGFDGWTNVGEVNVAGGIRSPSVEVTEERFPFFIHRHELRPDSAGEGQWRGGLGAICDLEYLGDGAASLNMAGDGVVVPPFGLFGGEPGEPHLYKIVSNGADRVLKSKEAGVVVNPGDRIVCLSSGGGGYGDPSQRAESSVRSDVKNGYRANGPRES